MSHVPAATISASASGSEKTANSPAPAWTHSSAPAPAPNLRSCVVCRKRKVRCDKQSPCSNCQRANIACVFPLTDRPPRWARRLERFTKNAATSDAPVPQDAGPGVAKVMERLRNLENLVKDLSSRLEHAHAAATSVSSGSAGFDSPGTLTHDHDGEQQRDASPITNTSSVQAQFGRLVVQDASQNRYVSSGFWSRVNDELDGLKMDTCGLTGDDSDSSEDETSPGTSPSTHELGRTPSDRHAFLFQHNLSPSTCDLREFHPLPSQVPFLLNLFSENVNFFYQIVHMPTVTKMVRELRGNDIKHFTPANEALVFSIYYAAITSMEEDDVMINFGSSKTDLSLKYRLGLEHALAKADFLNAPSIVLVQAFAIFLSLVRRHDSPRFVWMMTGILIRMAQYLGLQRDGTHFEHLTPFEIEMRRRIWWAVCMLDMRTSEDQGTDMTIVSGSFDTRNPLNINDADISPESKKMPTEREGITDMSFARISVGSYEIVRQMMASSVGNGPAGLEDQNRLLNKIYQEYEQKYFQYTTESGNIVYWVTVSIARLVMAKMTLIVFLPVLFSSPSEHFSEEIRTKLLISAVEVAEYNHALNSEEACRQWRWVFQTYTHWHAIVYLMIEISRRPWSAIVERAWVALHSSWLIPAQAPMDKNMRMWFPLRKLMAKARRHRDAELNRLRADPQAAARLEMEDQKIPLPSSSGPFATGTSVEFYRERWRKLVAIQPDGLVYGTQKAATSDEGLADSSLHKSSTSQPTAHSISAYYDPGHLSSNMASKQTYHGLSEQHAEQSLESLHVREGEAATTANTPSELAFENTAGLSNGPFPNTLAPDWSDIRNIGPSFVHWLWADTDPSVDVFSVDVNMDLDGETDWYHWVESAKEMTRGDMARPS